MSCPICHSKNLKVIESNPSDISNSYQSITCLNCGAESPPYPDYTDNTVAWKQKTWEGGFGSGRIGHSSWMKDIEFGGNYKKCPLCNINTNFENGKCEICGNSFAGEKKIANEAGELSGAGGGMYGYGVGIPKHKLLEDHFTKTNDTSDPHGIMIVTCKHCGKV